MSLQFRHPSNQQLSIKPVAPDIADENEPEPEVDSTSVTVSYGIHHGRYPIGGMTVGDARRTLQRLINIAPNALAVINGAPVDEEHQITEDVSMISFVKPSAMKG
jgi:hypothetical protein